MTIIVSSRDMTHFWPPTVYLLLSNPVYMYGQGWPISVLLLLLSCSLSALYEGVVREEAGDSRGVRTRGVWHSTSYEVDIWQSGRMAQLLLCWRVVTVHCFSVAVVVAAVGFFHFMSNSVQQWINIAQAVEVSNALFTSIFYYWAKLKQGNRG